MLLLGLHDEQFHRHVVACRLFPLGTLVYKSGFLPRFLGIWLLIAGCGWSIMCFTGFLLPQYQNKEFVIFRPAFFGELALMLWLVVKGGKPPAGGAVDPSWVIDAGV